MAAHEHDREDLLREATALVERIELQIPWLDQPVVAGFRRNGGLALFFGGDPVYQFNSAGELRRAFVAGLPYKAVQGRLIALERQRTARETSLVRHTLSQDEETALLAPAAERMTLLATSLQSGDYDLLGQVPPVGDVLARVAHHLAALPSPLIIAQQPHAT